MERQRLRDAEKWGKGMKGMAEREETGRKPVPGAGARQGRARAGSGGGAAHTCARAGGPGQSPRPPARRSPSLCPVAGARSRGPGAPPAVHRGSDGREHSNLAPRAPPPWASTRCARGEQAQREDRREPQPAGASIRTEL